MKDVFCELPENIADVLGVYGEYKQYELEKGEILTVLSTCSVPIECLEPVNWSVVVPIGNFRQVASIDRLSDGTRPRITLKSPERIFTKEPKYLATGWPWWGGSRSQEKRTTVLRNPVVEEQSLWEAIILLELHRNGIRAEVPQAILQTIEGSCCVIVNTIQVPYFPVTRQGESLSAQEIRVKTGLVPEDYGGANLLTDCDGFSHIIDVNRWAWPPYTDDFRRRLIETISNAESKS
ncbi:hypothetical protein M1555_03435 [Patescibacteria group bacterium]|nr:hypothetical protein [Patescibacteria group bacterium]